MLVFFVLSVAGFSFVTACVFLDSDDDDDDDDDDDNDNGGGGDDDDDDTSDFCSEMVDTFIEWCPEYPSGDVYDVVCNQYNDPNCLYNCYVSYDDCDQIWDCYANDEC